MKFEKRRAHIEMLGAKTCRITTPLKQKTFDLENMGGYGVDLFYLDKKQQVAMLEYGPSRFYVYFRRYDFDSGFKKFKAEVYACISPDGYIRVSSDDDPNVNEVAPGDAKTFTVTVYMG